MIVRANVYSCHLLRLHSGQVKVNQSHYRSEVPRGFQEVKVSDYATMAQDCVNAVSLTHRPLFALPENTPITHFC